VSLRAGMAIPFFYRKEKNASRTLSQPESRRMGGDKMAQQQKEEFHGTKTLCRARRVGARRHLLRAGLAEQAGARHRPLRAGGPGRHHREIVGAKLNETWASSSSSRNRAGAGGTSAPPRREISARRLHRAIPRPRSP